MHAAAVCGIRPGPAKGENQNTGPALMYVCDGRMDVKSRTATPSSTLAASGPERSGIRGKAKPRQPTSSCPPPIRTMTANVATNVSTERFC